jgi:hypothetical protein
MADPQAIDWIAAVTKDKRTLQRKAHMGTVQGSRPPMAIHICRSIDMPRFNYDDIVNVRSGASADLHPCKKAWVVAIFDTRPGPYFDKFPDGVVYMVEFEDGSSLEIHENDLEPFAT